MRTRQSTHESQLIVNKYFNLSSRLYEVNFKVIFLGNLKVRFPKKLTFFHTLLLPVAKTHTDAHTHTHIRNDNIVSGKKPAQELISLEYVFIVLLSFFYVGPCQYHVLFNTPV